MNRVFFIDTPIFFTRGDRNSDFFEEMINAQHESCCNDYLSSEYISESFGDYTHGCMILDNPKFEDRNFLGHSYCLKAFTIFKIQKVKNLDDVKEYEIRGKAICSNKNNKGCGRILLDVVKTIAQNNGIKRWIINSLSIDSLVNYYENYGFKQEALIKDGNYIKAVTMKYYFGEGEDRYNYNILKDGETIFELPGSSIEDYLSTVNTHEIFLNLYQD